VVHGCSLRVVQTTVFLIKRIFGNIFTRGIVKFLTEYKYEGKSLLHHGLLIFSNQEKCLGFTPLIAYHIINSLLNLGALILGVDVNSIRRFFSDKAIIRGIETILRSIAKYGVTIPQKLDAPFLVVWNFTNMCNLRCKHCYQKADKPLPNELTLEEKLNVLDQLEDAGVSAIAFSGGEPLMHHDFWVVAEEAVKRGFYVSVATNGTLITRSVARKLKSIGVKYVEVSLDSVDPEKHDSFRGVKGCWERTIEGIRNCVSEGVFTGIATTVTKQNYMEAEEIVKLAKKLNVPRVIFFNFIPVGRGVEIFDYDLNPHEREIFLKKLYDLMVKEKLEILSTAPQYARIVLQESRGEYTSPTHFYAGPAISGLKDLADFIGGCGAGRIYCALQPNGDVTPCVFIPQIVLGNLRSKSFKEIWEKTPVLKLFRDKDLLKENCGKCDYRYVCGGCRARAIAYFNDILAPDPGCKNNLPFVQRLIVKKRIRPASLKKVAVKH